LKIFGTNVAEEVSSQRIFYFSISPKHCFCTTWGNTNLINWVFSLKRCMLFCQQTHKRHKTSPHHIAKLPFTVKMTDCMHHVKTA